MSPAEQTAPTGHSTATTAEPTAVMALPVTGLPEIREGDDLAALIAEAARPPLADGDIVVVSSKVVSKAEGRTMYAASRDEAVRTQTLRVVAERVTPRGTTRIVASRSGPVLAAAGVDASNVDPGTVLLLPADPDASAARLREGLTARTGCRLAVLISDTAGRPWREGQVDLAVGAAALQVVDDLRGGADRYGNPLEATVRALADEIASLADLVKGKLDGVPVAVVRGLPALVTDSSAPGAASLLRPAAGDWFRYGHVEAVRTALGVPPLGDDASVSAAVPGAAQTSGAPTPLGSRQYPEANGHQPEASGHQPRLDEHLSGVDGHRPDVNRHLPGNREFRGVGVSGVPGVPMTPDSPADRTTRAVAIACAVPLGVRAEVLPPSTPGDSLVECGLRVRLTTDPSTPGLLDGVPGSTTQAPPAPVTTAVALGMVTQRLLVAAWSENLVGTVEAVRETEAGPAVEVCLRPSPEL